MFKCIWIFNLNFNINNQGNRFFKNLFYYYFFSNLVNFRNNFYYSNLMENIVSEWLLLNVKETIFSYMLSITPPLQLGKMVLYKNAYLILTYLLCSTLQLLRFYKILVELNFLVSWGKMFLVPYNLLLTRF